METNTVYFVNSCIFLNDIDYIVLDDCLWVYLQHRIHFNRPVSYVWLNMSSKHAYIDI